MADIRRLFSAAPQHIALVLLAGLLAGPGASPTCTARPPIESAVFVQSGFGANWSHANGRIAYNRQDTDTLHHVFTINPDGSDEERFGQRNPNFPRRTTGSPVWHPSGKYLAFVAEKDSHPRGSTGSLPGWGGFSDLWLATADGSQTWQLTNTPSDRDHGTLLPEFSPDGRLLEWTERTRAGNVFSLDQFGGYWVIKLADFVDDPDGPRLENIRTIGPNGDAFNETGGFNSDASGIVFTSNYATRNFFQNEVFYLDLSSQQIARLTNDHNAYSEHPRFTPDGRIIWMSSEGHPTGQGGTDWWIMDADGSNKTRLTYFNDPSSPEYAGSQVWTGVVPTTNWSDDGSFFYGDVELNLLTGESEIVRASVTCS